MRREKISPTDSGCSMGERRDRHRPMVVVWLALLHVMPSRKPNVVSLAAELEQLQNAAEGARLLIEAIDHEQFGTERETRAALPAGGGCTW